MKKLLLTVIATTALALTALAASTPTTVRDSKVSSPAFSSPAAQVSWKTDGDMTSHSASAVATSSAKTLLGINNESGNPSLGYGGTYNCSYGCSVSCTNSCSNTCSTNYRCQY